jgi:hypothetical protein
MGAAFQLDPAFLQAVDATHEARHRKALLALLREPIGRVRWYAGEDWDSKRTGERLAFHLARYRLSVRKAGGAWLWRLQRARGPVVVATIRCGMRRSRKEAKRAAEWALKRWVGAEIGQLERQDA